MSLVGEIIPTRLRSCCPSSVVHFINSFAIDERCSGVFLREDDAGRSDYWIGGGFSVDAKSEWSAEEIVKELTRAAPQGGEFPLSRVVIKGRLDLRHRIVPVAVTLTNCTFTDEVDLEYCEFKQRVDFSRSCFKNDFNSRDAIYRKDLHCEEVIFRGGVTFEDAQCERSGYFGGAQFENPHKEANFIYAEFGELAIQGEYLFSIDREFQGDLDENNMSEALRRELENQRVKLSLSDNVAVSTEEKDRRWLLDDKGNAQRYTVTKVAGDLQVLHHQATTFKGRAVFNGLQCKRSGFFSSITFDNPDLRVNFGYATFGEGLVLEGAIFRGGATFYGIRSEGRGHLSDTLFDNPGRQIDFSRATFGGDVELTGAVFKGGATFNAFRCENGYFNGTRFDKPDRKTGFSHATFGCNLSLEGAVFKGGADFEYAKVSGSMRLQNTEFLSSASFNGATIQNLLLGSSPFKKKDVDLRRLQFEIFEGGEEQRKHMLDSQSPEKLSMDPYLQFEQYYRSIGNELDAKRVYRAGRVKVHKNMINGAWRFWRKSKDQERDLETRWSLGKMIFDSMLRWMAGYGVRMLVPSIWIIAFLLIGTCVFWPDEALVLKRTSSDQADGQTQSKTWSNIRQLCLRMEYSLDLFIPIVDLRVADDYKRPPGWRGGYAFFHIIMGWLLVPMIIASLSRVVRQ